MYFQYEPNKLLKQITVKNTHKNPELPHFEEFED